MVEASDTKSAAEPQLSSWAQSRQFLYKDKKYVSISAFFSLKKWCMMDSYMSFITTWIHYNLSLNWSEQKQYFLKNWFILINPQRKYKKKTKQKHGAPLHQIHSLITELGSHNAELLGWKYQVKYIQHSQSPAKNSLVRKIRSCWAWGLWMHFVARNCSLISFCCQSACTLSSEKGEHGPYW